MPPRLGVPASPPQSMEGRARGPADSVTLAARPALRRSRRRRPEICGECCPCIGKPPWKIPLPPLPLQPQGGRAAAVIVSGVGSKVLHMWVPGARDTYAVEVHIVLLLRNIPLQVKDDLLARLTVLHAPLFLKHGRDLGVVDMAAIAWLVGGIQAIQDSIRLPGITDRAEGHTVELPSPRRRHIGAVFLDLEIDLEDRKSTRLNS